MSTDNFSGDVQRAHDDVRSDGGVGGEVVADANASDTAAADDPRPTQNEPSMDASPTTVQAKIEGIVAQTRSDFPDGADPARLEHALRQRFRDTGIEVSEEQVRALAAG